MIIWGDIHHSPEDYIHYNEDVGGMDHGVIIVGWKDDPSIGNGGYWICKNSWGENWGYNGFFNIEYGSHYIDTYEIHWVDYDPDDFDWYPIPKINGPYYGLVDEAVEFQGDAAGEQPPFTYHWDFGDESTSNEQNPTYAYPNQGDYTIEFTVTDDNGRSMTEETYAWIQETNQPPDTPIIEGPTEIEKGKDCWYNITYFDPDGTPLYKRSIAFNLDYGIWYGPYKSDNWETKWYWNWTEEGDYIVKAKARDIYGAESDWAILEVTVQKSKTINDFNPWISRLIELFPILKLLI
jgi:hypothetical protein